MVWRILIKALLLALVVGAALFYLDTEAGERPDQVLGKLRHRCLSILGMAMKNENAFVRGAAARAAGESEDRSVLPLLAKAAEDVYPTTRLFALQSVKKISPKKSVELARSMVRDRDIWVKSAALEMLGDLSDNES